MEELVFALFFLSVPALVVIFYLPYRRWRAKDADAGAVLLRVRPAGARLLGTVLALLFLLAAALFVHMRPALSQPGPMGLLLRICLIAQGLVTFALGMLPVRVCENGLADAVGFLPWEAVSGYEEKRPGRFLLRLKEDRPGRMFGKRTCGLDCPPGLAEELGKVLRTRVGCG